MSYSATNPKRLFVKVVKKGKSLNLEVNEGTRKVSMDEALKCIGFQANDELVLMNAKHYDRIAELAWRYKELG